MKTVSFGLWLWKNLLLTSEDPGSNPAIIQFYKEHLFFVKCLEKTKKEKCTDLEVLKTFFLNFLLSRIFFVIYSMIINIRVGKIR